MEDTIKLPLDADGVPIMPGDVVYYKQGELTPKSRKVIAIRLKETFATRWTIELKREGHDSFYALPNDLTHTKPDTLETIEKEIRTIVIKASLDAVLFDLDADIAPLMERIKRMVER